VPEFNSLVAFRIPRFHEVTAVTADRARYSIFGWFLTEGVLYDLYKGEEQEEAPRQARARGAKAPKKVKGQGGAVGKGGASGKEQAPDKGDEAAAGAHGGKSPQESSTRGASKLQQRQEQEAKGSKDACRKQAARRHGKDAEESRVSSAGAKGAGGAGETDVGAGAAGGVGMAAELPGLIDRRNKRKMISGALDVRSTLEMLHYPLRIPPPKAPRLEERAEGRCCVLPARAVFARAVFAPF
jgi:hypothetical protein